MTRPALRALAHAAWALKEGAGEEGGGERADALAWSAPPVRMPLCYVHPGFTWPCA